MSMSASLKGFHRTDSPPAAHACHMSDVAYIELPSSKTRGQLCEVVLVVPDQAATTHSMVTEMHHVCSQAVMRVAVVTPFCMHVSSPVVSL